MTRFVIDAPTLIHLVRHDVPVHADHRLVAPNLIRSQASTLLLDSVRSGEVTQDGALDVLDRIAEVKMRVLNDRVSRRTAWQLAHDEGWATTFDAEYVAVCRLQADALVTVDDEFAARVRDLVPIAPLDALMQPSPT